MEGLNTVKINEKRICIYAKDIQILTGKSERYARKVISQVRKFYTKDKSQLLTIKEFCDFMHLDEYEVRNSLLS
jgi:hypothetical protein